MRLRTRSKALSAETSMRTFTREIEVLFDAAKTFLVFRDQHAVSDG